MELIILASDSMQRREYLKLMGLPFKIMPSSLDENFNKSISPLKNAEDLALKKVKKVMERLNTPSLPWIVGADTLISIENEMMGKPKTREDAKRMLSILQGRSHDVITGIALYCKNTEKIKKKSVSSIVSFCPLSEAEIEWYLDSGEWQGAAGAYRIQGLASCFVTEILGSYSSIVGLPLYEFYVMLKDNEYPYGVNS